MKKQRPQNLQGFWFSNPSIFGRSKASRPGSLSQMFYDQHIEKAD